MGGGKSEGFKLQPAHTKLQFSADLKMSKLKTGLGVLIGDPDAQIAGHAFRSGIPLLADNEKYFRRVEGLEFIAWSG